MKNPEVLFIFLYFVLLSQLGFGQNAPKYSNEFLSIGVGARAFGMANSTVASTSDLTSTYWNPAALTKLESSMNLGLMHSEYFAGLSKYDYGGIAFKLENDGAFAITFIRFAVDNIPNTLELIDANGNINFDKITSFSVADYAVNFSYAKKLQIDGLSVGGSAKIIRRVGGDFASAWGFGIDISGLYELDNFTFGFMARDITTTFNSWKFNTDELKDVFELTGNVVPENSTEITLPKFILGVAYSYNITDKIGILGELNLDATTDGKRNVLIKSNIISIDPHIGFESNYNRIVFLRFGVGNIQKEYDNLGNESTTLMPNMGLGFKYKRFAIDYALTDLGNVSAAGYSHIFTLTLGIEKKN
ncbi:MAG: PorV/PorQ family protein [Salinivirgaceae bacterium]|nr:PorV/PorQ family protein [Salinivirgaceae bacterium]